MLVFDNLIHKKIDMKKALFIIFATVLPAGADVLVRADVV